nr:DNA polymerase III subunit delta [Caldalkalibacillus salinus]
MAKKNIKQGDIAPIYVLYGSQKFLMEEMVKALSEQLLDSETADFNFERFDLMEDTIQGAVESAETLPFMGEKRLIVAQDANFLTGSKGHAKVEHKVDRLEQYAASPSDYTVLVLLVYQDKLDQRKKVVKSLKKSATLIPCTSMKTDQLVAWVKQRAQGLEVHIEDAAAGLLTEFVGSHLQILTKEIEKLGTYVGRGGTITPQVIEQLVSKTMEHDVFSLVDHVVHLRFQQAYQILQELLKRNEEPIKILFLIARQFRIVARVKELDRQGYTQNQMAQQLSLHPYVCKLALQQGKQFSRGKLVHVLDAIAEADYEMKTGKKDKALILQMFLLQLRRG